MKPEQAVDGGTVDTHCHLFLMEGEPQHAVETARAAGVETIVCAGIDPESSRTSLRLAGALGGVRATAGMHPHTASELDRDGEASIARLLEEPLVVAVGECGLDFYRNLSPRQDQERVFRFHAALSRDSGKELVVHVRDAWTRALQILAEESPPEVVLHCFSGDPGIARESAARGYHLSFACNITYPKNEHLRQAAAVTPLAQVLVETDSPYLAPASERGKPNSPKNALIVVERIAEIVSKPVSEVARILSENSRRAFPGLY